MYLPEIEQGGREPDRSESLEGQVAGSFECGDET